MARRRRRTREWCWSADLCSVVFRSHSSWRDLMDYTLVMPRADSIFASDLPKNPILSRGS